MNVAVSQTASDSKKIGAPRDQPARNLVAGAEGARPGVASIGMAALAAAPVAKLDAIKSVSALRSTPICLTCQVQLRVAVFFDGTGNNLNADVPTNEHSNVAKLFRSHLDNDPGAGIYALYVPGLGTYFKDIGDPGEEWGAAFGKMGEPRLAWAMERIDQIVAKYGPAMSPAWTYRFLASRAAPPWRVPLPGECKTAARPRAPSGFGTEAASRPD